MYDENENILSRTVFFPNEQGQIADKIHYNSSGNIDYQEEYTYNEYGDVTKIVRSNSDNNGTKKYTYDYTFDENENIKTKTKYMNGNIETVSTYENGKISKETSTGG